MDESARVLIPSGTVFAPEEITFYADADRRSLDDAIAEADLLVSCPHSGAAIPAELDEFLAPEFTRRLQYDFSDCSTSPSRADGRSRRFTTLSFHDTMNHTTTRDGAVNVDRDPKDLLPAIVALSNRGDHHGDERDVDPADPVTMRPDLIRALAEAHRVGFDASSPDDVQLNQPYLGSQEIIASGARFRELAGEADAAGVTLSAVQAEFLREFLLGERNAAEISEPGTGWVDPDPGHVDRLARACKAAWDEFRAST